MRIAAAAQGQAANGDLVGLDGQHGSLAATINNDLAIAFQGQGFGDAGRAAVGAGWQTQDGARQCCVDPGLQGLVGVGRQQQAQAEGGEKETNGHCSGFSHHRREAASTCIKFSVEKSD